MDLELPGQVQPSVDVDLKFKARRLAAESIDLSIVIERYRVSAGISVDMGALHAREFVRYVVVSTYDKCEYPMAGPADEFWHVFLQFTRLYREFCMRACGVFVEHEPLVGEPPAENSDQYIKFLSRYSALYNELPCSQVWPTLSRRSYASHSPRFKFVGLSRKSNP